MSVWSILLRMMLCLGLILNGSGYALASTSMPMEHSLASAAAAVTPAARTAAKADVPCHQQKHGASETARSPSSASLPVAQSPNDEPPAETPDLACDCCESGLCRGTCMHQGQAAVPAASQYDAVPAHDCDARPARPGHAAPALSHLIRPPIA